MLGGREISRLQLQKQAVLLESSLNRVKLQAHWANLRASSSRLAGKGAPALVVLAPIAGFLVARKAWRSKPSSWIGRLATAVKIVGPAIALARSFRKRQGSEADEPGR